MKHSEHNLAVIQNFILHVTHSSSSQDEYAKVPMTFTPDELYQMAEEYIEEDHVDGKDNHEDDIVTYSTESSYENEDKEKEFPEHIVVVADFGDKFGTKTCATISGIENLQDVQDLIDFIKCPEH